MDTKGLQKEFISWCKSKNKSPKTKEETQQLFVSFMKEKHPEEYKKAVESQQQQQAQQAQKALHGAKLQYFRKLKNQCAEDEEVVYYKKGGSVNCGCKKKEDGGEVRKAGLGCSAIDKFKKMKKGGSSQINPNDTIHINNNGQTQIFSLTGKSIKDGKKEYKNLTPKDYQKLKIKDKIRVDEKDAATTRGKDGIKIPPKTPKNTGSDELLPIKHPNGKPSGNKDRSKPKAKIDHMCGGGNAITKFKNRK